MQSVGLPSRGKAFFREFAQTQWPVQRERMAGAALFDLRGDNPDIAGKFPGNTFKCLQAQAADSIVIRQQYARFA